jgi:hypothetical protein
MPAAPTPPTSRTLNRLRRRAAARYKPQRVRLLLVAETPPLARPPDPPRYFYFENVSKHDYLFRAVVRGVLGAEPDRRGKSALLTRLRRSGVFLIDLKPDPSDPRPLSAFVQSLVRRCRQLRPKRIILIKTSVYDEAYATLVEAGLPVAGSRVPFPGWGQRARFAREFGRALDA